MSLDMAIFAPREIHKPLALLGKHQWLTFQKDENFWMVKPDESILSKIDSRADGYDTAKLLLSGVPFQGDKEAVCCYALSKALAYGPKMFFPTALQCQAFENTVVNIPFGQYCQPYETLFIKFPQDYIEAKKQEGVKNCPEYVFSWFDTKTKIISVTCQFEDYNNRICGVLSDNPEKTEIEALLSRPIYYETNGAAPTDAADFQTAQLFERIAVNLNLLMMYGGGSIETSPVNKAAWARYRELKKRYQSRRDKEGLRRLRDFGLGEIERINFTQEIAFKTEARETAPPEYSGVAHHSPEPHWRKGHWTSQPYGPKQSLRKPLLRQPVYVIGRDFRDQKIDLEKTSVTYNQVGDYIPK